MTREGVAATDLPERIREIAESIVAAVAHDADVFELGDLTWKAVCSCGWECWDQPSAQAAWDTHEGHAHFEMEVRNGR